MEQNIDNGAEKTLTTMASIILICGLAFVGLCGLSFLVLIADKNTTAFAPILIAIPVLFGTLVSWSVMKVLANISLTLKDINKNLEKEQ